ncbi:hypothetical protein [Larkinella arboricola]
MQSLTAFHAPLRIVVADLLRDDFNYLKRAITYSAENPGFQSRDSHTSIGQIVDGSVKYWDYKNDAEIPVTFKTIQLEVFADRYQTEQLVSFDVQVDTLRNYADHRLTGLDLLKMIEKELGGLSKELPLPVSAPYTSNAA